MLVFSSVKLKIRNDLIPHVKCLNTCLMACCFGSIPNDKSDDVGIICVS
jgi:hypothetical protein